MDVGALRRPPTAERPGLPARSLARAKTAHAREGFETLSPNGERLPTAERQCRATRQPL